MTLLEYLQFTGQNIRMFMGAVDAREYYHNRPEEYEREKGFSKWFWGEGAAPWYDEDYHKVTEGFLAENPGADLTQEIERVRRYNDQQIKDERTLFKTSLLIRREDLYGQEEIMPSKCICTPAEIREIHQHPELYKVKSSQSIPAGTLGKYWYRIPL